jgi:2-hydroxy fatty acid dioxygenase
LAYDLPRPTFLPQINYHLNDYLEFEVTYGTLQAGLWLAYYYLLEPVAAVRLPLIITDLNLNYYSFFTPPKQFCLS